MPTVFDALASDDGGSSSSSSGSGDDDEIITAAENQGKRSLEQQVFFEDLTQIREDEDVVLEAVYGEYYSKEDGVWGYPILCVHVRPPDIKDEQLSAELTLKVQLVKKYPLVSPSIQFENVKGLSENKQKELRKQLKQKCRSLTEKGEPMVCELVQCVEEFLVANNFDPTISEWDQMNKRKEEDEKAAKEDERKLLEEAHHSRTGENNSNSHLMNDFEEERIKKEYERQIEALKADEGRRQRQMTQDFDSNSEDNFSFDEDGVDFDDAYNNNDVSSSSRYKNDFIELDFLGRGGGGRVVKVRNRLDRRIYAIKKVLMQSEKGHRSKAAKVENGKLLREVTTISRMTHKNIVRYYQAWVEGEDKEENEEGENNISSKTGGDNEESSESSEETESSTSKNGFFRNSFHSDGSDDSSTSWSDVDELTPTSDQQQYHDDVFLSPLLAGMGINNNGTPDVMKHYNQPSAEESSNIFGESESEVDTSQMQREYEGSIVLHIQMEYCSTTLRHLIDDGSVQKMKTDEVWEMIRQTLEALDYIHKRKVIHRDLKPGNIFLDAENSVRLGDFGLATTRKSRPFDGESVDDTTTPHASIDDISHLLGGPSQVNNSNKTGTNDVSITGGVGTRFYTAPEQESNRLSSKKGRPDYDTKADIFSLGVVIFEMFHSPFTTLMHRAETLEKLRASGRYSNILSNVAEGHVLEGQLWKEHAKLRFPENFEGSLCPENAQKLILWCLQHSPEKRPSAEQILKSDLMPQLESRNEVLKAMFNRQTASVLNEIDITYDTDAAAKVRDLFPARGKKSVLNNLMYHLREFGGLSWKDMAGLQSSALNDVAMVGANTGLIRALNASKTRGESQHVASILAMSAAATSASTGVPDGFLPRVVDSICDQLSKIFESHGAVRLKPPLLRPKGHLENTRDGFVEVMNERGNILLLPEDLTASFARAVGRAGGLSLKRYNIDRTYHRSRVGGHPRESLEASFDIVLEGANSNCDIFEAEVVLVISQVVKNFIHHFPSEPCRQSNVKRFNPFWFLRLTHTRLSDAILDICDVPAKESTRRACFHILSRCSAPPPALVLNGGLNNTPKSRYGKKNGHDNPRDNLDSLLDKAIKENGLTIEASDNLKSFLSHGCLPLPADVSKALQNLLEATKKLRSSNERTKRNKRYADIARGINRIQNLVNTMDLLGLSPSYHNKGPDNTEYLPPSYISLDLGMRQRQKQFQGQLYFQAILLPDDCEDEPAKFDKNDLLLSGASNPQQAIKIAEGGHYEELVRKFRPPGNFGSIQLDKYTSAPIPMCVGARIFVRRLIERAYTEASFVAKAESLKTKASSSIADIESTRRLLGHPPDVFSCIQCIVVSMDGFDPQTLSKRAVVAAHLWSKGISCEYVAQSGVMMSLLKHTNTKSPGFMTETNDWTIDQIGGICSLLKIPFLVIVQDHLLKEKKSVRLRIIEDSMNSTSQSEYSVVPLSSLASIMKDHLGKRESTVEIADSDFSRGRSISLTQDNTTTAKSSAVDIECIFVDSDQYYMHEDGFDRDSKWKSKKKLCRTSIQRAESYLKNELFSASTHGEGCILLAVNLPFPILREFDSAAMFGNGPTVLSSVADILENHVKYRKTLKTLAMCVQNLIRRQLEISYSSSSTSTNNKSTSEEQKRSTKLSVLVYSVQDDMFDLLTLSLKFHGKS